MYVWYVLWDGFDCGSILGRVYNKPILFSTSPSESCLMFPTWESFLEAC